MDIGFGDVIYPDAVKMEFPVILDMETPKVYAYSLETTVAEKLEAIIRNGYLNSRYKDFYDIYIISDRYAFPYIVLREAVMETFHNRGTEMTMATSVFGSSFVNDKVHKSRWNAFLKKKRALIQISFEDAITVVKKFAEPLLEANHKGWNNWDPEAKVWK